MASVEQHGHVPCGARKPSERSNLRIESVSSSLGAPWRAGKCRFSRPKTVRQQKTGPRSACAHCATRLHFAAKTHLLGSDAAPVRQSSDRQDRRTLPGHAFLARKKRFMNG